MRTVKMLLHHLELDQSMPTDTLTSSEAHMPWYTEVVLGIGAWISALALLATSIALLGTTLSLGEEGLRFFLIIMGVCSMAAGAYVHRGHMALFARQFALALSLGGQAMVIGGLLFDSPSLYLLTGVSLVMTVVLLPLFRDRLHQFASTALTCFLLTLTLFEESVPHP
ncbi:MAG: DUF4401 domain-containing protein, partial [Gammaproteobacteria bacterium]|nr:DUF4401 domain-containing protein [Gammaproteobacteria bacterium]